MSTLKLYLLGALQMRCDAQALPKPPTLKSQSLLAYLVLHRTRPQAREHLADLFWGDRSERKARQSLSTALWHIRRCLPDAELIVSDIHSVQFDPGVDLWLDVDDFESRATGDELNQLRSAAALYRGDFLDGFYDDWIINERYRLEALYADVLARLMGGHEIEGEHQAALATALLLLERDPLREDAHRLVMRTYCRLGQRNLALEQYRRCRRVVLDELGAEPMIETTELYEAIVDGRFIAEQRDQIPSPDREVPAPAPPFGRSPLDVGVPSRLVGREKVLARLNQSWIEAAAGRGGLVLVDGEAGVGKTRLAEEFATRLRRQGACVLWGRCYEFERVLPYQPIAEALRTVLPSVEPMVLTSLPTWVLHQVARLVPELLERRPGLQTAPSIRSDLERARFFDGLFRFFRGLSSQWPLLVILDDLHWATESTLQLVHYLTRLLAGHPVLLVGTFRPEAIGRQHPLQVLQQQLGRGGLVTKLHLARLTPTDVQAMVIEMSGAGEAVCPLARRLYQETEGNPFFLMESVKALFDTGRIRLQDGMWSGELGLGSDVKLPLPAGVSEAIQARVLSLNPEAREVLHLAALLGREFDFDVLSEVWGQGEEAALEALDTLLRRRLVEEGSGPLGRDYAFTHHKIQEVIYAGVPDRHCQYTHARIGAVMERLKTTQDAVPAGELAFHFEKGRKLVEASEWAERAGDQAAERSALEEAAMHYGQAITLAREVSAPPAGEADLLRKRAKMQLLAGEPQCARDGLVQAVDLARKLNDGERQTQNLLALADVHFHLNGFDQMVATAREALAVADRLDDRHAAGIALRLEGQGLHLQGQNLAARERLEQAHAWLREAGDLEERGWALLHLGWVCQDALGRLDAAQRHLEDAQELFASSGCADGEIWTIHSLGNLYLYRGKLQDAVENYGRALAAARQIGHGAQDPIELAHLALGHALLGDYPAARQYADECLQRSRQQGQRLWESYAVYWQGHIEYERGDLAEARRLMSAALAQIEEVNYQAGITWAENQLSLLHRELGGEENLRRALNLAQEAHAVAARVGKPRDQIRALSNQALAHLHLGHLGKALSCSEQAVQQAEASSPEMMVQELFYNHAHVLRATGRQTEADLFLDRAYQEVMATAGRIRDPRLRAGYLENVRLNRAITAEYRAAGLI